MREKSLKAILTTTNLSRLYNEWQKMNTQRHTHSQLTISKLTNNLNKYNLKKKAYDQMHLTKSGYDVNQLIEI